MARKAKCKDCGIELEKEERYIFSNKSYCKKCYDKHIQEKSSYDRLIKIIIDYFNIQSVDGLILKQIKEYKEKFNYTYDGITYTLWYCKEILNKDFIRKYGIALVKFEYVNAENYFVHQQKISQSLDNIEKPKVKKVNADMNKVFKKDNKKHLVDLSSIIGGK